VKDDDDDDDVSKALKDRDMKVAVVSIVDKTNVHDGDTKGNRDDKEDDTMPILNLIVQGKKYNFRSTAKALKKPKKPPSTEERTSSSSIWIARTGSPRRMHPKKFRHTDYGIDEAMWLNGVQNAFDFFIEFGLPANKVAPIAWEGISTSRLM
jgi:hypothetical protein